MVAPLPGSSEASEPSPLSRSAPFLACLALWPVTAPFAEEPLDGIADVALAQDPGANMRKPERPHDRERPTGSLTGGRRWFEEPEDWDLEERLRIESPRCRRT